MNRKYAGILILLVLVAICAGGLAGYLVFTTKVQVVIETDGRKGATLVKLDEKDLGTTDSAGKLIKNRRLWRNKSFRISFSHPEYEVVPKDTTLTVDDQSEWNIRIRLSGGRIELVVNTQPTTPGARIRVDDKEVGKTGSDGTWRGEVDTRDGKQRVYVVGPQGQREWETRLELTDSTGPLSARLGSLPGARLLITAAYKVPGVAVLVGGVEKDKTDNSGIANFSLPTAKQGQQLSVTFRYQGATIKGWKPRVPQTPAKLSHKIEVRPATPPTIELTAKADNAPASGIRLVIDKKVVGKTGASGSVRVPLKNVSIGQTVKIGVSGPENLAVSSLGPRTITIDTTHQVYEVQATFEIAKFIVIKTKNEQGAPLDNVRVFRKEQALGATRNGGVLKDRVPKLGQTYTYRLEKGGFETKLKSIVPSKHETTLGVQMNSLAFTVLAKDTFRSVPQDSVSVYASSNLSEPLGITDAKGRMTIPGWDLGVHKLVLRKELFKDATVEISLTENNQEVSVLIEPIPPQLNLHFRAEGTGIPIRNAQVSLQKGVSLMGTTDSDGEVVLESPGLAVGQTYEGEIQYSGFSESFNVKQKQHITHIVFDVPLVSDVTLIANDPTALLKVYDGSEAVAEGTGQINVKLKPNPKGYKIWGQVPGSEEAPYDEVHFFNKMVIQETVPVVSWYKKGMVELKAGNRDEANTNFAKVSPDDMDYGLAQIKMGEIALEKRKEASDDDQGRAMAAETVQAFENAWKVTGEWKYNPYFAHRLMTLNYEIDRFDQAQNWFYEIRKIGMQHFDPVDLPEKLVNSYFYEVLIPHGNYGKNIVPKDGDTALKTQLRKAWKKFETILNNQPKLSETRRVFYRGKIQRARDELAVWP